MPPTREPVSFDRYAEVVAHLRHFPAEHHDEVVARLGLRRAEWKEASARWSAARDAEIDEGRAELTARFGEVIARTRRRLEMTRASLESIGPLPPPEEPEPPPAAPEPEPEPVALPEVQRSSAQLGVVAKPVRPSFLVTSGPAITPPPVVIAPPPVFAPPPKQSLAGTLPLGAELPIAKLPFQQAPASPERAFENAVAHAKSVQGTSDRPPADKPPAGLGGTVAVAPDANPLAAKPPPGCPDLTLPQYASLRVELQIRPEHAEATLTRYGVAAGARDALDAHWRARFEADPLSRMEFARAYAAYLGWLRQSGQAAAR
jgi:hypothetical protein